MNGHIIGFVKTCVCLDYSVYL